MILLPKEKLNRKAKEQVRGNFANTGDLEIQGMQANASYHVVVTTVNGQYGNPLSVFLEGAEDYLRDTKQRIVNVDGEWKFATKYWEQCFFDELKDCAWRERARQFEAPLVQKEKVLADASGRLKVIIDMAGAVAVMVDVAEMKLIRGIK